MSKSKQHVEVCSGGYPTRLIAEAGRCGTADNFAGKRRWVRYSHGAHIELTTDPQDGSDLWSTSLHNISGGGFGIWSKRRVGIGQKLYIREARRGAGAEWTPARVVQCLAGLRGFLIGAAFDHPAPADAAFGSESFGAAQPPAEDPPDVPVAARGRNRRDSLGVQSALACAAAGLVGVATVAVGHRLAPLAWPQWLLILTGVPAVGALIGWMHSRDTIRVLSGLNVLVRRLAGGETVACAPGDASSHEIQAVLRAVVELARQLARRGMDERVRREKLEEINQIKSNILAIVSHDLRTPLTSILLYSRMLMEELDTLPREEQRRFLDIVAQECTRLSRLVDDLLDLQRLEAGQVKWDLRPQDLSGTILAAARVFDALAQSKSIEFTVECPESLPPVEADAGKVSQVVNNLLSNAMKYTQAGGKVRLWASATGNELLMAVADNGPGIPRDKWEQIFDRFAQLCSPDVREISGVGLGLYIVRQIVERHGGAVWVDSEVGRGSEFYVSLPIKAADPSAVSATENKSQKGRVLIGDADPALAAQISQTLRYENFDVRIAHSACRLLALLSQGETDVVVTDVLLPDMGTHELLEALAQVPSRSFRLIVHSFAGDGPDLRRRGVDVYLRRPASRAELIQAVGVAMQQRARTGATVVVVDSPAVDGERLRRLLLEAGHRPILADSIRAAADILRDSAATVVILSREVLERGGAGLRHLGIRQDRAVRVLMLSPRARERDRRAFGGTRRQGVTLVTYRRGMEERVVTAVSDPEALTADLLEVG